MRTTTRIAAAAVAATVLVPAAAAHGATRTVIAGPPAKVAKVPADGDTNAFYRKQVTVHVGDRVRWRFNGFHTVTIPAKGEHPPAFIGQDPRARRSPASTTRPATRSGSTARRESRCRIGSAAAGGKQVQRQQAGLLRRPAAAGTPEALHAEVHEEGHATAYYCTIHAGQKATVKVVGKDQARSRRTGERPAAKKEYAKVVTRQIQDDKFAGRPGNAVDAGQRHRSTDVLPLLPGNEVRPGRDDRDLLMSPKTTEVHTISFGPADYLKQVADSFIAPDPVEPAAALCDQRDRSVPERAAAAGAARPAQHGNGFFNVGLLDRDAATPLNPGEARVTFNTARHLQLHLPGPPRHEGVDRRRMRKLAAAGAGILALVAFPAPASAATRHVWIAAVPTTWNVVPNGRDAIEGERYTADKTTFRTVVYRAVQPRLEAAPLARGQERDPRPADPARASATTSSSTSRTWTPLRAPALDALPRRDYQSGSDGSSSPASPAAAATSCPARRFTYQLHAGPSSAGVWPYHDHSPSMMDSLAGGMYGALSILRRASAARRPRVRDLLRAAARLRDDRRPRLRRQHAGVARARRRLGAVGRARARGRAPHLPRPRPPLDRPGGTLDRHADRRAGRELPLPLQEDAPGTWLYHCHIEQHMMRGMIGLYRVRR